MLIISAAFEDWLGDQARRSAALVALVLGVGSAVHSPWTQAAIPVALCTWYPLFAIVACWFYGFWIRDRLFLVVAAVDLAGWLAYCGSAIYHQVRRAVTGLDQIVLGMVFFLIAMAISLMKAGVWPASKARARAGRALRVWNRLGWDEDPLAPVRR